MSRRPRGKLAGADTAEASGELFVEAASLYSKRYGRPVSIDEARLLTARLTTFFGVLARIDADDEAKLPRAA